MKFVFKLPTANTQTDYGSPDTERPEENVFDRAFREIDGKLSGAVHSPEENGDRSRAQKPVEASPSSSEVSECVSDKGCARLQAIIASSAKPGRPPMHCAIDRALFELLAERPRACAELRAREYDLVRAKISGFCAKFGKAETAPKNRTIKQRYKELKEQGLVEYKG